jgi:hypothetical protein
VQSVVNQVDATCRQGDQRCRMSLLFVAHILMGFVNIFVIISKSVSFMEI